MRHHLFSTLAAIAIGMLGLNASAAEIALTVHTDQPAADPIDQRIYGQFLEHIFNSVHGGLWGDQILNGPLELRAPPRAGAPSASGTEPFGWTIFGPVGSGLSFSNETAEKVNGDFSLRLVRADATGGLSPPAAGLQQKGIVLAKGEKYTLTFYLKEDGKWSFPITVDISDDVGKIFSKEVGEIPKEWKKFSVEFTPERASDAATLSFQIGTSTTVYIDQVSLFSAAALANGGFRPDLLKAVLDLKPATIRWPGGSFANKYIWQDGVGPRDKRSPHVVEQWGDRDPNHFGTDEFLQLCEKNNIEPILVLNTARGLDDALHWLEYCMGDATTVYGKQRAANGHAAPYTLNTIEIDNETWLLMKEPAYIDIIKNFCPAIHKAYPKLQLSVCGSYAYDTGPGEGSPENAGWDQRLLDQVATDFNILSPHYYNGLLKEHPADFVEDPRKYEAFLKARGEAIKKSANPNIKIYVSEWNLTQGLNDWRMGLYAGGILNAFERQSSIVQMACPALFMRKIGVTRSWDNALINFDGKSWFPGANYVVMKLWREAYAPTLLPIEGPDHPLNIVATRSADSKTFFFKVVNPLAGASDAAVTLDGAFTPAAATMSVIAPGAENVRNTIAQPENIKPVPATVKIDGKTIRFTMPALSAAVVQIK